MQARILAVPYHLGQETVGPGKGPDHLLTAGIGDVIKDNGHEVVAVERVRAEPAGHETGNVFAVNRELARRVAATVEDGDMPIVLAGNCNSAIGVMAGLAASSEPGLVFFDAHGDSNTPETTETGFFDGFPIGVVAGWCWKSLAATVPGHHPVPASRVMHVGGRSFDGQERDVMIESGIRVVSPTDLATDSGWTGFTNGLTGIARDADRVHLHIDLDVIDISDGVASRYAEPDGPTLDQLERAVTGVTQTTRVTSVTICSFDPSYDEDGRATAAALRLMSAMARGLRS